MLGVHELDIPILSAQELSLSNLFMEKGKNQSCFIHVTTNKVQANHS